MVREAKPPVVPPRPNRLRPRPHSPAPPTSSSPLPLAVVAGAPPPPSRPPVPPPSIYSQPKSAVTSSNLGVVEQTKPTGKGSKDNGPIKGVATEKKSSKMLPAGTQPVVSFGSDANGGSRTPSLGSAVYVVEKRDTESSAEKQNVKGNLAKEPRAREQTPNPEQVSTRKQVPTPGSSSGSTGKQRDARIKITDGTKKNDSQKEVSLQKPKERLAQSTELTRSTRSQSSKARGSSVGDVQSLIRSNHSSISVASTIQHLQQRQNVYRRSAEARALYAEAKDHYGKAKNHLQEALRLSVDVLRLTPHILVENVAAKEIGSNRTTSTSTSAPSASLVSRNKSARPVPEYPGLGIQYRSLFTPLLASVSNNDRDRKQALAKKRADDALAQDRAGSNRQTGAKASGASSSRSGRSSGTARTVPDRVPATTSAPESSPASISASVTSRGTGQSNRQRTKRRASTMVPSGPASVSTRTAARMRDNYEYRSRPRTRSAASRRLRKRKEEEVDHGILWFFSY
ncbi:uncharacterized protein SPSK_03311 [Sporothrix schenckii 1099-18]|uniref:Uncharacterized protein n=1 Tax=Sporothrix schenckii 1099-18 TaxID=1397361 RepID=A0A0F2LZS1_SPOSC|nr:uncharacterized protein SPSK_03311 [Sporothrix schenckii 1099-18]KJR82344.1 hypothetical protein SPSK_03311 [Sporothrix schenckii 1099-18]